MQNHVKYLVVDDDSEWVEQISSAVREYFEDERSFAKARIREFSALNATQANQHILAGGWDLVMLDMNLGAGAGKSRISGLDLLGEIARSNRAYFVIIVTGAVTDPSLEKIYGTETASLLRFGAMNEATRLMPASRIRILHKPNGNAASEAMEVLRPHLHSALDQYCSVSLERNIFRPLPGETGPKPLWQVCYNGSPRVTLSHAEPYKMIRSALAQPDRALKVIQLMQAVAHSSGEGGAAGIASDQGETSKRHLPEIDYKGHQQDEVSGEEGLDWEQMSGLTIRPHTPVEVVGGTIPIEVIIGGLLNRMASGELERAVQSIATSDLGEEPLLAVPKIAAEWARRGEAANAEFEVTDAPGELMELNRRLAPLLAPIKKRWLAKKAKGNPAGKKAAASGKGRLRVAQRVDTPEMRLARHHWTRFKKYIGRRPVLKDFMAHILKWIPRDPTTRGHLHYRPPADGEFMPFWLTE